MLSILSLPKALISKPEFLNISDGVLPASYSDTKYALNSSVYVIAFELALFTYGFFNKASNCSSVKYFFPIIISSFKIVYDKKKAL